MGSEELTAEQVMEALLRCLGAEIYTGQERNCEGCPLYEDSYCIDTLVSAIREKLDNL